MRTMPPNWHNPQQSLDSSNSSQARSRMVQRMKMVFAFTPITNPRDWNGKWLLCCHLIMMPQMPPRLPHVVCLAVIITVSNCPRQKIRIHPWPFRWFATSMAVLMQLKRQLHPDFSSIHFGKPFLSTRLVKTQDCCMSEWLAPVKSWFSPPKRRMVLSALVGSVLLELIISTNCLMEMNIRTSWESACRYMLSVLTWTTN